MKSPFAKTINFLILFFLISGTALSQLMDALPRHAYWGASFSHTSNLRAGAVIRSVVPGGFTSQIDLKPGDIILKVNNITLLTSAKTEEVFYSACLVKGGTVVSLDVIRNGKRIVKSGTVPPRPKETFNKIVTEYKSILSPRGHRVQAIITRPENVKGKMPGIFLVRWMSCDPIEKPIGLKHGVAQMLEDFIQKSGYAVIRVEKSGLGDSEGCPCYDADFNDELLAHQSAYDVFRKLDFVDSTKIVVFAQSNGAAYAPLVVGKQMPAAFVISGGWANTWFEHMLEYKRKTFELDGNPSAEITRKMNLITELYLEYLIHKQTPGEVVIQKPHLKEVWDGEYDHQWGLPVQYMQQLQDLDIATAWSKVNVPTYIFYGDYDIAMTKDDHQKIADLINKNGKDLAKFEVIPQMSHSLFWFDNILDQETDFYGKGVYKPELAEKILAWSRDVLSRK
jgi:uncharacterized protein